MEQPVPVLQALVALTAHCPLVEERSTMVLRDQQCNLRMERSTVTYHRALALMAGEV
jgi:hypothetical protein